MDMQCRCGNEIKHVPEHLRKFAYWVCQKCFFRNVSLESGTTKKKAAGAAK